MADKAKTKIITKEQLRKLPVGVLAVREVVTNGVKKEYKLKKTDDDYRIVVEGIFRPLKEETMVILLNDEKSSVYFAKDILKSSAKRNSKKAK